MKKRAAALKDSKHICPLYDGKTAHKGGKVKTYSPNVYIENKEACRNGDILKCNSESINKAVGGSTTVFINGKNAIRLKDPTLHGGIINDKGAKSVNIG